VNISRGPLDGLWVEEIIPALGLLEPTENGGILTINLKEETFVIFCDYFLYSKHELTWRFHSF
jgi:hypothetical protein